MSRIRNKYAVEAWNRKGGAHSGAKRPEARGCPGCGELLPPASPSSNLCGYCLVGTRSLVDAGFVCSVTGKPCTCFEHGGPCDNRRKP
jgi:hypothetical protein